MPHNLAIPVILGAAKTGLTLTASLLNVDGTAGPALTTLDLLELAAGSGTYGFYGTIPDGFSGYIQFKSASNTVFQALASLNPQENENANIHSSAIWDEPRANHLVAGSFGLAQQVPRSGTAQGGSASSITLDAGASSLDNFYQFDMVFLVAGTGAGQTNSIASYAGSTRIATVVSSWVVTPDSSTTFVLLPFACLSGSSTLTAAQIWSYAIRTLTQAAAALTPPLVGTTLSMERGDTITINFSGLGSLVGRTALYFTAKHVLSDPDGAALIQISEAGGLLVLNGAAATPGQGSLVVTDQNAGSLTITLTAPASALLRPETTGSYDVQKETGAVVLTLSQGAFNVVADVTRAIT